MDNIIDILMAPTEVAKRFPMRSNPFEHPDAYLERKLYMKRFL